MVVNIYVKFYVVLSLFVQKHVCLKRPLYLRQGSLNLMQYLYHVPQDAHTAASLTSYRKQ